MVGSPGAVESTKAILQQVGREIAEIYLGVKVMRFGSGRDQIYDLSLKELVEMVRMAEPYGVEISVAFNAPCYNGLQFSKDFLGDYSRFLEALMEVGINHLIIADSYLIRFTLKLFPHFHISVSSLSYVDSPEKAKYYEKMGVRRIILPIDMVRNLNLLKSIRKAVSCELEIMANLGCIYQCPYHTFHGQFHGHNSRGELAELKDRGDPYKSICNKILEQAPWRILNGSFLRPEDIPLYEKMGIEYLKLAGREISLDFMLTSTRAYLRRSWRENLLELLTTPHRLSAQISVDNAGLEGFVDQVGSCSKGWRGEGCPFGHKEKNGCEIWADKVMRLVG